MGFTPAGESAAGTRSPYRSGFSHPSPAPERDYSDGYAEQHLGCEEVDDYAGGVDEKRAAA